MPRMTEPPLPERMAHMISPLLERMAHVASDSSLSESEDEFLDAISSLTKNAIQEKIHMKKLPIKIPYISILCTQIEYMFFLNQ